MTSACECNGPGFCQRHKCNKTAHWFHLCQTRPDYFQLWEQGRGPGQSTNAQPVTSPTLFQKFWNLTQAVTAFVADGCKTVDQVEYARRLAVCESCEQRHENVCLACGCYLSLKAGARAMDCPLGRWAPPEPPGKTPSKEPMERSNENEAQATETVIRRVRANPAVPRGRGGINRSGIADLRAAVVVVAHNYGHFLKQCVESVLAQTSQPAEIVIVDDASTDDTPNIGKRFASRGVRYRRIESGNVHHARRIGFESVKSEIICFLDADDLLPPDYLASGVKCFADQRVGVVYSDVELFGTEFDRTAYPTQFDRGALERDNFIHAGSLVRREALRLSRVFEETFDPLKTHGDWFLWRRILRDGWTAARQGAAYRYRQHGRNWTAEMHR